MSNNPLQQYFRQPKIYIGLPSKGIFNKVGTIQGDSSHMPVFSMTGMDEVIVKTPDALMTGESTVKVIESCCPTIKDAWDLSNLDVPLVLAAIRIATYGNDIKVYHKCKACGEGHEYSLDLSRLIEHYNGFKYDNTIKVNELTIRLRPLTYKESSQFAIKNYVLQKQLAQAGAIEDETAQQEALNALFVELSKLQNEIFATSIETVETPQQAVTDRTYINEWIQNCDKEIFDQMKKKFDTTRESIKAPPYKTQCDDCGADNDVLFELDESTFFDRA